MALIASRCPGAAGNSEVSDMAYRLQLVPKRARTYRKHMRKINEGSVFKQKNKHKRFWQEATFLCVCMCVSVIFFKNATVSRDDTNRRTEVELLHTFQ